MKHKFAATIGVLSYRVRRTSAASLAHDTCKGSASLLPGVLLWVGVSVQGRAQVDYMARLSGRSTTWQDIQAREWRLLLHVAM